MRLLSRHILRTFVAPFFWGLLALTGLLLLNNLATLIDRFGGRGLGMEVMVEAIILALPALLTLTLPMAVLVGTLYAYTNLAADLEMMAMYANGVSVWRMVLPVLWAAAVIAAVNFFVFDQLVPISNTRLRTLGADVARLQPTLSFRAMEMNRLFPTPYVLRADDFAAEGGRMRGVTIWDLGGYNGRRMILADSGQMATSENGFDLLLTLWHGETIDISLVEANKVERTAFVRNRIRIRDVANQLERRQGQVERGDREQSGCQLLDGITAADWTRKDIARQRATLTRRDLRHLAGLAALRPAPVPSRPERTPHCGGYRQMQRTLERLLLPGRLEAQEPRPLPPQTPARGEESQEPQEPRVVKRIPGSDTLRRVKTLPPRQQFPEASSDSEILGSLGPAGQEFLVDPIAPAAAPLPRPDGVLSSIIEVNGMRAQSRDARNLTWRYGVEYHKKFALPLAAFCFVLVGVTLALKYPQSGIGLVIGGSLVIFLMFYVLLIGGENLADKGVISPTVAMYAPVVLFTLAGLAGVTIANREMGTGRTAGILEAMRDLVRRRGGG